MLGGEAGADGLVRLALLTGWGASACVRGGSWSPHVCTKEPIPLNRAADVRIEGRGGGSGAGLGAANAQER